jgi:lipid II:glycine glycyltransferase (peptidoglycan interpeptide bridge formation enzyme)
MTSDLERLRTDDAAWDAFVEASETSFPLQMTAWATAKAPYGWRAERVLADGGSGPIGAQILVRALGPGPFAMGYAPRGPVVSSFDAASLGAWTGALRDFARSRRLTHVTSDPGLEGTSHHALFTGAGWQPADALQLTSTQVIDLSKTEEELWHDVYKSSRRYANGARKSGCYVEEVGPDQLPVFYEILAETATRSGFIPRALEAYADVYRAFAAQGKARILIGYLPDGTPVSSKMLITSGGRMSQLYGGLTDEGGKARSGHFFEWEAIIRSKAAGATVFDMWGRSTKGIAHFKQGFGGRVVEYGGTFDLVVNAPVRSLYRHGRRAWVRFARRRRGLDADTPVAAGPSAD